MVLSEEPESTGLPLWGEWGIASYRREDQILRCTRVQNPEREWVHNQRKIKPCKRTIDNRLYRPNMTLSTLRGNSEQTGYIHNWIHTLSVSTMLRMEVGDQRKEVGSEQPNTRSQCGIISANFWVLGTRAADCSGSWRQVSSCLNNLGIPRRHLQTTESHPQLHLLVYTSSKHCSIQAPSS
ncbi:hypothetical protein OG21DRAFT_842744 [Imleria badia]|nr:hypothetical protein OG21DRAFT_842744 [Imleria badia]